MTIKPQLVSLIDISKSDVNAAMPIRPELLDPVEYRKSGLSLNHVIGCPLDCAYCVRHLFGNFNMREPHSLMDDREAVRYLIDHKYFVPHRTPIQIFNRATDPFLKEVKPHTFSVLEDLDARGLNNHVLIITRYHITDEDCVRLNSLSSVKVTLLITYSGITNNRIEPISSEIAVKSLDTAFKHAERYRVILYWRPIVPGLNDSEENLKRVRELSLRAHATVFTGLFYRDEIKEYYQATGLPEPYPEVARRKILPRLTEARILKAFSIKPAGVLFRKTSCGVCYAHNDPDYNGHYGIREVCDICPTEQISRCGKAHRMPDARQVELVTKTIGQGSLIKITKRAVILSGFNEQQRYFLQHAFAFQFHDATKPHRFGRHGRAELGWEHAQPNHT